MAGRTVGARFWVDWNFDGSFTEETTYLIDARGDMRLAAMGAGLMTATGIVSQMSVTLRNASGRYSPQRTDGALYAFIANGGGYHAPCYLEITIDGGSTYDRVFTGVLKLPQESTLSSKQGPTVTFDARSMEERYLQQRISVLQATFAAQHDAGYTEADYIEAWLDAAGVAAADMTLDAGLFVVPWAWVDDESAVEECWRLAAACGGRLYCDPDGEWRFENMAHWQTSTRSTTTQLAITRDSMERFELRLEDGDLYNVVTVEASPRAPGGADVIWEPDDLPLVAPGATVTITARFDAAAYSIAGVQFEAADDGGNSQTANVTVTPTYYAQRADLVVVNASNVRVRLYPLRIVGQPLTGGPEIEERRTSADDGSNQAFFDDRGDRTLSVRGNAYVQTRAQAATMAQYLLDRCEVPRITAMVGGAAGDPALRLGDRVTVADAPTMSATFTGYVTAIGWTMDRDGFRQDLEVLQASQLFPNDGNYFVLGTHNFASDRYVFY